MTGAVDPIIDFTGVNKSFGPVHVLHDVDFRVYPGQVTALVGDNGAGKSVLVKTTVGIYQADSGQLHFEGRPVHIKGPKDAAALGIEVVYQDLALCDNLDIVQNMFLGREVTRRGLLDDGEMEQLARTTLSGLNVHTVKSIRQSVSSLSGGQRQTVAIRESRCCGTQRWSCWTSRPRRSVSHRPLRCSRSPAGSPSRGSGSS